MATTNNKATAKKPVAKTATKAAPKKEEKVVYTANETVIPTSGLNLVGLKTNKEGVVTTFKDGTKILKLAIPGKRDAKGNELTKSKFIEVMVREKAMEALAEAGLDLEANAKGFVRAKYNIVERTEVDENGYTQTVGLNRYLVDLQLFDKSTGWTDWLINPAQTNDAEEEDSEEETSEDEDVDPDDVNW